MNTDVHETLDKVGEAATVAISNAAGAVADPATGLQMIKAKSRKMAPLVALFVLAVALVSLKLRRSGDG